MTAAGRHAAAPGLAHEAWSHLARLVLPVSCGGCSAPDQALCRSCRDRLPRGASRVMALSAPEAPAAWSGGDYAGVLQRVILAFKDGGRHDLAPFLARSLTRCADVAVTESGWQASSAGDPLVIVPAPSAGRTVRRRGADLTAGLALAAAAGLRRRGWPATALRALRQRRGVKDQAGLSGSERMGNVSDALRVRHGVVLEGRTVLLVDDVVTTGATLAAAAAALEDRGALVLAAATVAATPKLNGWTAPRRGVSSGLSMSDDLD